MVCKRPFCDEEPSQISSKLQRQLECNDQLPSSVDIIPSEDIPKKPHGSAGEVEGGINISQSEDFLVNGNITELRVEADKDYEMSAHDGFSSLPWATSSSKDEYKSDPAVHLSSFPGFFETDLPMRTLVEHKEIYSSHIDFPPRRSVPIGPDHQADVPTWGVQGKENEYNGCRDIHDPSNTSLQSFGSIQMADDNVKDNMMGTCIIPMPDSELFACCGIGKGRTDCNCEDRGSVRCVRQHILEAREKLRVNLEHQRFVELGFCDMGEEVAKKWSEEEEHVFHEVVFSYPASMGKNFWDNLPIVFPSRTKKELVSYYFNVFMLRRRGVQNRMDPHNIDSDNDEWQGSEDGDDGFGTEDEDSVVESPFGHDNHVYSEDHRGHFREEDNDEDESDDDDGNVRDTEGLIRGEDERSGKDLKPHTAKSSCGCNSDPGHLQNCEDIQDDSCTSYECQPSRGNSCGPIVVAAKQECRVESEHCKRLQGSGYDSSCMGNFGYEMEFCDSKIWNLGYLSGRDTDVDLSPTCNMMKEVFGDEAWNNKGRDSKSIS